MTPRTPGGEAEDVARVIRWNVDSETGVLRDVLLGPPENFQWLPTSAISKATLASGAKFDAELALAQHRDLVSIYESAGVTVHRLEADPALPYQVFARDSSINTPEGPIVTQLSQSWRRGEYAPVVRFYNDNEVPIWRMITGGSLEGGDVQIVEPGVMLIGNGEERTEIGAAR
jgi:N-dimethylarginine dimethylaminohydrolase